MMRLVECQRKKHSSRVGLARSDFEKHARMESVENVQSFSCRFATAALVGTNSKPEVKSVDANVTFNDVATESELLAREVARHSRIRTGVQGLATINT